MTSSTSLNAHDRDNLRDACMSGLVPCDGTCGANETRRDFNAADWTLALRGATEWRRERVATLIRRKAPSLTLLARDAGLVPHGESTGSRFGCCDRAQRINRDAAAVLRWEWRSQSRWPETHDTYRFHLTAWDTAR